MLSGVCVVIRVNGGQWVLGPGIQFLPNCRNLTCALVFDGDGFQYLDRRCGAAVRSWGPLFHLPPFDLVRDPQEFRRAILMGLRRASRFGICPIEGRWLALTAGGWSCLFTRGVGAFSNSAFIGLWVEIRLVGRGRFFARRTGNIPLYTKLMRSFALAGSTFLTDRLCKLVGGER